MAKDMPSRPLESPPLKSPEKPPEKTSKQDAAVEAYLATVDAIAAAVKKLSDAGVGGAAAGDLALKIYQDCNK